MRILHWNVRRFKAQDGSCTVQEIQPPSCVWSVVYCNLPCEQAVIGVLRALNPTVVTLNEVDIRSRPNALGDICAALGMKSRFFGHVNGFYGNAVLSHLPSGIVQN